MCWGCLNRWIRVGERFSPLNVHKWVLKLGLKNLEKLMYCTGNERLQKTKREESEQCAQKKFCNRAKFARLRKFANLKILLCSKSPAFCYTYKTENKIHESMQMKDREKHYKN